MWYKSKGRSKCYGEYDSVIGQRVTKVSAVLGRMVEQVRVTILEMEFERQREVSCAAAW
jgi:hypothetical protein